MLGILWLFMAMIGLALLLIGLLCLPFVLLVRAWRARGRRVVRPE